MSTSLTRWRHRCTGAGEPEWTLVSFNDADHLTGSALPASPPRDAVPLPGEGPAAAH